MSRQQLFVFSALLILLGAAWGLTQPLAKIAVSTGHQHFGLIFWQFVIGALSLTAIAGLSGRRLPMRAGNLWTYLVIAVIGTVIPNSASYQSLAHIPAGLQSVLMSLVPMVAFPIAILLVLERFELRRSFVGVDRCACPGSASCQSSGSHDAALGCGDDDRGAVLCV